jgi:hypothetical protein
MSFLAPINPGLAKLPYRITCSELHMRHFASTNLKNLVMGTSWPIKLDDISPIEWWRTMPADLLGDVPHLILRETVDRICVTQDNQWLSAMRGDAAASIAIAVVAMPIDQITLEVDLVMTILTICALDGSADATLALAHILYRVELHHPFAQELSLSWLVTNLRCACSEQKQPITMRYGSNNSIVQAA